MRTVTRSLQPRSPSFGAGSPRRLVLACAACLGPLLLGGSLALLLGGCSDAGVSAMEGGSEFIYENTIFPGTQLVTATAQVSDDAGMPRFSWVATSYRHVVCAIFDERVGVTDGLITNPHRMRWIWHSGLSTGREGNVLFEHGVSDPQPLAPARTLAAGTYYWAVWALDAQGFPVASSKEYTLALPLSVTPGEEQ